MDLGSYKGLAFGYSEGFRVIASDDYWKATHEEILARTGDCGPGKFGDKFVPDTLYGESIFIACQIHDWMYWVGRTLEDKRIADFVFFINMVSIVGIDGWFGIFRLWRCGTYYYAVAKAGEKSFLVGKDGHNLMQTATGSSPEEAQ